ncbi:MAG: cyclic nucleotide-binding domain-containing protein [Actinomycetota bacterium]
MAKGGSELLAQVPLFSHLSRRHLKRLADSTTEQRFMEGAAIVREGEEGDSFFVIVEGQATVRNAGGKPVNQLVPGDFFGEISLLDGGARTATVVADTPMRVLVLKRNAFRKIVTDDSTVATKLLEYAATMLRRLERPVAG